MNGPTTAATGSVATRPPAGTVRSDLVAVLVAGAAALLVGLLLAGGSPGERRIEVHNPSPYDLTLRVRSSTDDSWTPLLSVPRGETRSVVTVDRGGEWVFSALGQGVDGPEWVVPADRLAAEGWSLSVPDEVGRAIEASGAPPSPSPQIRRAG